MSDPFEGTVLEIQSRLPNAFSKEAIVSCMNKLFDASLSYDDADYVIRALRNEVCVYDYHYLSPFIFHCLAPL